MAISYETIGTGAYYRSPSLEATSSISWTHNSTGGADSIVIIGILTCPDVTRTQANRQGMTATVTYGGVNAMFVGYSGIGSADQFGCVYMFAVQNPPSGSQTVGVTIVHDTGVSYTFKGTSVSYLGVRGIHRVESLRGNGSTGTISVASAAGRKLVHVGANSGTTFSSYSQNLLYSDTTFHSAGIGDANGASSVTFSWSRGSSAGYGSTVLELVPVDEAQRYVTIRSMGEGNRTTGASSSLSTSWTHRYDGNFASYPVAIAAVTVSIGSSTGITCSVTYGGQSMTEYALSQAGSGSSRNAVGLYYLVFPPTGNSTVSVTTGGDGTKYAVSGVSVIYENVLEIANLGNLASIGANISNTQFGDRYLAVLTNGVSLSDPNRTELYKPNGSSVTGVGDYALIQEDCGNGGTVNFSATGSASTPNSHYIGIYPNLYNRDFMHLFR